MYLTSAIVLSRQDVGEHDALFNLYTKEYGKMRVFAQGVKKSQARLRGHLEPLSFTDVGVVLGRNGARIVYAVLVHYWDEFRLSSELNEAAHHVAALMDAHCFSGERDEVLWQLVLAAFADLDQGRVRPEATEAFMRLFETRLADRAGIACRSAIYYNVSTWENLKS